MVSREAKEKLKFLTEQERLNHISVQQKGLKVNQRF